MKARLLLPTTYALVFAAALLWMFTHAKQTALAGIFAMLLTLPWSVLGVILVDLIFPRLFDSSLLPGTLLLTAAACINLSVLIVVGARIDAGHRR